MTILFHPKKNIGRVVEMVGKKFTISSVTKDLTSFRVKEESHGPVVTDYNMLSIEAAEVVTVSLNGGEAWIDIPIYKA